MTLIIGIKCSDGVVMASDGAATFGVMGQNTIRQTTTKLDIVENRAIVGVSGPVGLGQLLKAELQTFCQTQPNPSQRSSAAAMTLLRDAFWKQIGPTIEHARVAGQLVGQPALSDAISQTVVAIGLKDGPALLQFSAQASPEAASDSLPFVAIGSGQQIADPFLAFLRRIFWPNSLPTLQEGLFSAVWTLEHAIQTNPGGVAEPKQIIVLEQLVAQKGQAGQWKPRALDDNDIQQHMEWIASHEKTLATFHKLDPDAEGVDETIPAPPTL